MAPPLQAWRQTPTNRYFTTSSAATRRANQGFSRPGKARSSIAQRMKRGYGPLKGKTGPKGLLAAAGVLPAMAGLGALIGGVLTKKKKKQEGRGGGGGVWRVSAHQPFLLNLIRGDGTTWRREIHQASNDQLRALTDVIRNLYDGVVPLPTQIKLPLKKHIREIRRLSGLKTPLYERRALLLALGARLLPFLRTGLKALEV